MGFAHKPSYWWVCQADGADVVDLTPYWLRHQVKFGLEFLPRKGQFTLYSAKGRLTLDARSGAFDYTSLNALLPTSAYDSPIRISYGRGQEILWSGVAIAQPAAVLSKNTIVTWQLRGWLWQGLDKPTPWRVATVRQDWAETTPLGFLRGMLDRMRQHVGRGSLVTLDANAADPDDVKWLWPAVTGTAAQNLGWIAQAAASVPYETRLGTVGTRPVTSVVAERSDATWAGNAAPDDQRYAREMSKVWWEPRRQPWAVQMDGPVGIEAADLADLTTAALKSDAWVQDGSEWSQTVKVQYAFAEDVHAVRWIDPVAPAGVSAVSLLAKPLPIKRGDLLEVTATAAAEPQNDVVVTLRGQAVRSSAVRTVTVYPEGTTENDPHSVLDLPIGQTGTIRTT